MPSTTPLTDAINALTTYANTVTSASDTTLSDAVATLASGYGGGGDNIIHWTASRATGLGLQGIVKADGIEYDFNNIAMVVPAINYCGFDNANHGGSIVFKNLSSSLTTAQMNCGDLLRQAPCITLFDFGGLAPSSTTRWFYQWGYSATGSHPSGTITIKNLCLDNLSSQNSSFPATASDWFYRILDCYWTGYLQNNIDLSGWNMFNADSWNRLMEHLYDYSDGTAHTLTLGSTIIGLIDAEHQAIATARNWTLA